MKKTLDARIIYILVVLALVVPLRSNLRLPPAPMKAAEDVYAEVDKIQAVPGKIVVIAADWGPGTSAENQPQTELVVEHLFRKRVPFALVSIYQLASPMMREMPLQVVDRLKKEMPDQDWQYGKDWVNLGYLVNSVLSLQSISKAADIQEALKTDANGTPIGEIPIMRDVHSIKDVQLLVHLTGLVNVFNYWLQFFRTEGYSPPMLHGCTSISIPEAYMYYSSKQIRGFFEGVAGAAWYDKLLNKQYPNRVEVATRVNTGLGIAQLVILGLIVLGNVSYFMTREKK